MFLKSIEMIGFKSFPDKIDLIFPKGITCVVGPNGSGKSNISDAIRWVMGEQSIKTLRGGKMEDVIFSGTQKRKQLGFCEVTLIVDNEDRALPIDFDEIMITRRIFRSGESEYYINKSACRMKDIHELFMDTGLGKDGYSIVGQGKIDSIISGKPSERRVFFEEACGISKYHHRKDEAERKLLSTNDNILRVNDIILELETQLEPLKVQSEKAKKYLVLRDELKELEVNVWIDSYHKLKESEDKIKDDYDTSTSELSSIKTNLEKLDVEIESLNKKSRELQEDNDRLQQENYNFEYNIKTFENQIEISKNNILHQKENIKRVKQEKQDLLKKVSEFDKNKDSFSENIASLNTKKAELEKEEEKLNQELNNILNTINTYNSHSDGLRLKYAQKNNELLTLKGKKSAVLSLVDSLKERADTLNKLLEEKELKLKSVQDEIHEINFKLDQLEQEEQINKEQVLKLTNEVKTINETYQFHKDGLNELSNEYIKTKNQMEMLQDMENNFSAYPRAVKEVMNANLKGVNLYGTLASLVKTDPQYAVAIDSALASSVNNIVCDNEQDAKEAIAFLKMKKAGKVTFMPIASVKPQTRLNHEISKEKGFVGIATDLISCDNKFSGIVENLLNRVAIFDNIDHAIAVMKKFKHSFKTVTLTGEIFNVGGSITGGEFKNSIGAMKRNSEIETLNKTIDSLKSKMEDANQKLPKLKEELEAKEQELHRIENIAKDSNKNKIELLSGLKYKKELESTLNNDIEGFKTEQKTIKVKSTESDSSILNFDESILKFEEELNTIEQEISLSGSDFDSVLAKKDKLNLEQSNSKLKLADILKDLSYEQDKINAIEIEKQNYQTEILAKEEEINRLNDSILDINDEIEFRSEQIAGLKQNILEYSKNIEENKKSREKAIKDYEDNSNLSKSLREKFILLNEENTRLEVKVNKIQTDIEQIINNLWETYEMTLTKAEELKKDIGSMQEANKKIGELKSKIKGLGNINIDAIEEYETVNERYTFLTAQRDDLTNAKENLENIISEMLKLMKEIFSGQFELIAASFNETYIELFGGGRAQLLLTDPSNVLESGIEIEVQPPGKKLTTISLLSGGEKAFTAIALLFSIIKIKPTPFCLFDEIEAALDDVNVYRYAEYLTKFKEQTQFIVITHRRGTMEVADTLYGVTMQEKGVSKLLSLNIDEIEEEGLVK